MEAAPTTTIDKIIELCADSGNEIVSYGLAPNPNGFCYERGEDATYKECQELSELLDLLTNSETVKLRSIMFD